MDLITAWVIGGIITTGIAATVAAIFGIKKPPLCKSCKYLLRRGGGGSYKYYCKKPHNYTEDWFDRPPKYCRDYKEREADR